MFTAGTFVVGQRRRPRMSRVQRVILEAQDAHVARVLEREPGAYAVVHERSERAQVFLSKILQH